MGLPAEKFFYVYCLRRPDKEDPLEPGKGQPFYVGKGSNGRIGEHLFEAKRLLHKPGRKLIKVKIIHKLWKQGLDYEVEIIAEKLSAQEAFQLEISTIQAYGRIDSENGCLANMTAGGDGGLGRFVSDEERNKKRLANLGKHHSEETKQKLREAHKKQVPPMKGKRQSAEARQKMSLAKRAISEETRQKYRDSHLGQSSWNKGKPCSEETKQKLRGQKRTEETKQKIREARARQVRRPCSEETKRKIGEANRGKKSWNKKSEGGFVNAGPCP